jgi:hypothetical protein
MVSKLKLHWNDLFGGSVETAVLLLFCSPVFDGLFDFCSMSLGGSLEGAYKLNNDVS